MTDLGKFYAAWQYIAVPGMYGGNHRSIECVDVVEVTERLVISEALQVLDLINCVTKVISLKLKRLPSGFPQSHIAVTA